jgi:hypothetical protein
MVIIAYHSLKSNFAAEMPLIEDLRYVQNYADIEFIATVRTSGCLIVVNVASNGEPSVSILPCSVP